MKVEHYSYRTHLIKKKAVVTILSNNININLSPHSFQYFVFDFHMAPAMLFDKIITLSVSTRKFHSTVMNTVSRAPRFTTRLSPYLNIRTEQTFSVSNNTTLKLNTTPRIKVNRNDKATRITSHDNVLLILRTLEGCVRAALLQHSSL